jgi:hypothetical protein
VLFGVICSVLSEQAPVTGEVYFVVVIVGRRKRSTMCRGVLCSL